MHWITRRQNTGCVTLLEEVKLQEPGAFWAVPDEKMSCLNYHLITGLGRIAGDDVPSWLLDYRFRLMFPQIKNPPEALWNQAAVCQYLLSQDSWVSKIPGRKKMLTERSTLSGLKNPGEEQHLRVMVNFPFLWKVQLFKEKMLSLPLSVLLRGARLFVYNFYMSTDTNDRRLQTINPC